ncbi:MAG: cysteine desulfurase family protein [Geminicoccaceae bacterium]
MERIYLDYNASTPIASEVKAVVQDLLDREFGNPSAHHWASTGAREIIEAAHNDVANLLGCSADEVVLTSGGSESINHALKGAFFARRSDRRQIITTRIEHPAVLSTCAFLERLGAEITYLPVDRTGKLVQDVVQAAISDRTLLLSLAHANGEVGTIQNIGAVAEIVHSKGGLLHVDAAQSAGKIEVDIDKLGADLLSIAGHKMYAPKGVGALYIRRSVSIEPLVHGAGHQSGRRAGTESALLAAALGTASRLAMDLSIMQRVRQLRDNLFSRLQEALPAGVQLNGHPDQRLPNTLNVSLLGQIGSDLLARATSLAATTGSACHEGRHEMSPVLAAMGIPEPIGLGAIRFSLGRSTTEDEIAAVPGLLAKAITR